MYTLKICALIALAASTAQAADTPKTAATPAQAKAPEATNAMRAHIDPKTGELTETPIAPQRPQNLTTYPSKVEEIQHADGMIEYRLNGEADSTQTASLDAAGNVAVHCAEHGTTHAVKESNDDHH